MLRTTPYPRISSAGRHSSKTTLVGAQMSTSTDDSGLHGSEDDKGARDVHSLATARNIASLDGKGAKPNWEKRIIL